MTANTHDTKIIPAIIWLMPALATFWLLRYYLPDDNTLAQIAALPFCVIALATLVIAGNSFSRRVLCFSALLALAIAATPYLIPKSPQRYVFVERFSGDTLGNRTHIFIEALNSLLQRMGNIRAVEWRSIEAAAAAPIDAARDQVILRGDEKLIVLHLGRSQSVFLDSETFPGRFLGAAKLELVTWVPVIALSTQPYQATAEFLTSLLSGALPSMGFERGKAMPSNEAALNPNQEMLLWSATMRSDRWRSAAHRALPAWLMANRYLIEAFRSGEIDVGELQCAIKSYDIAARFIRYGDNPELYAAINNNRGVAWYLMSLVSGRSEYRSHARKYLGLAAAALRQPNLFKVRYFAGYIARRNLGRLGIGGTSANIGHQRQEKAKKSKKHARPHHHIPTT